MPFYDYKCKKCAKTFEVNKGMNDKTDQNCPECGSEAQRIFNVPRTMNANSGRSEACGTCSSGVCSTCSSR